jgi:hypothetical protein
MADPASDTPEQPRRAWLYPVLVLGGVALGWFLLVLGLDYTLSFSGTGGFWSTVASYSPGDAQSTLGNLPEVVVGVLGIAITVVSIVLQLSATRYTPRVTEMFFRDRTNLMVMGFFVVASINCVWATFMIRQAYIPHLLVLLTMVTMTAALLVMIPYFAYVFAFLDPERIVLRLQQQALAEALGRGHARAFEARQHKVLLGIEQLADVAVNSISQKDRIIASRGADALRDLTIAYADSKADLEESWFTIGQLLRRNPDFVGMAPESVDELSAQRTWLEWKVLRQYQTIYTESLNRMRDVSQLVAINTRYIGEKAILTDDAQVLSLTIKFFNTYLRATLNARDVRSAYNTLHQYRQVAEAILNAGWNEQVIEVAQHFKYYGQTANACGLAFINETAAYDLCTLCELAHSVRFPLERELLGILLEVDKVPETEAQEISLRGVRKAQLKLATFYLVRGAEELARLIWRDMEHERSERLQSIRAEMLAVKDKHFWEVIDRGHNFDYLDPERRDQLETFYSWFKTA